MTNTARLRMYKYLFRPLCSMTRIITSNFLRTKREDHKPMCGTSRLENDLLVYMLSSHCSFPKPVTYSFHVLLSTVTLQAHYFSFEWYDLRPMWETPPWPFVQKPITHRLMTYASSWRLHNSIDNPKWSSSCACGRAVTRAKLELHVYRSTAQSRTVARWTVYEANCPASVPRLTLTTLVHT
jgi:hypothetical protein